MTGYRVKNLPHNRVPSCSKGISDQGHCVYSTDARIGNKQAVADYDDD